MEDYDAFISYSHALDGKLAPTFQRELERFAKPWYRLQSLRVFRDDASLTANPGLWTSIEQALSRSRCFVLMASPEAGRSQWVNREVAWWLAHCSVQHLLIVLTGGELAWDDEAGDFNWSLTSALPPVLHDVLGEEPRWVDLRWLRDVEHADRANPRLNDCVADVAAAVMEKPKDLLIGEHIRQHRRAVRLARGGVTALVLLFVAALVGGGLAFRAAGIANHQLALAVSSGLATKSEQLEVADPATAALLAAAAWHVWPTAQAREAMLDVLAQPERAVLPGGSLASSAIALSPDGKILADIGTSDQILLWNTATGQQISSSAKIRTDGYPVALSAGGRTVVTETNDGVLQAWDVATGEQDSPLRVPAGGNATAYGPGGALFTCLYSGNTAQLWDVTAGHRVGPALTLPVTARDAVNIAFSPDLQTVAQVASSGAVYEENIVTGRAIATPLTIHGSAFRMAVGPGGDLLATANPSGVVTLWNMFTGQQEGASISVPAGVDGISFSPDGTTLATSGDDGAVRLWNVDLYRQAGAPLTLAQGVYQEAFSPSGMIMATTDENGIGLWNLASHRLAGPPIAAGSDDPATQVIAFDPDGKIIAATSGNDTTQLWDVATRRPVGKPLPAGDVSTMAFDPSGSMLATAVLGNGSIRLWDTATQQQIGTALAVQGQVLAMAFSPDGKTLFAAGGPALGDGTWGRAWQVSSHRQAIAPYQLPAFGSAAFGSGGSIMATASADGTIRVWDPVTRSQIGAAFTTSSGFVKAMAFSPAGGLLATVGSDSAVQLWDTSTDREIGAPMTPYIEDVKTLAFSPSGNTLATGGGSIQVSTGPGGNGTIWLWDVAFPKDLLHAVCTLAGHPFTRQQWAEYVPSEPFQQACP